MAGAVVSGIGHLFCAGIPRPRLLVRRGLGSSLVERGRFGPLVSGGSKTFNQCQEALGGGEGSASLLPYDLRVHSCRLCGQLDDSAVSAQARRNSFSRPQLHCLADPPIFFALPRSEDSGDRCSSSELGWTSGIRFSILVPESAGSEETSLVLRSPHDSSGSVLASEALVSLPVRSGGGRSSSTSLVSKSYQTASLPLS